MSGGVRDLLGGTRAQGGGVETRVAELERRIRLLSGGGVVTPAGIIISTGYFSLSSDGVTTTKVVTDSHVTADSLLFFMGATTSAWSVDGQFTDLTVGTGSFSVSHVAATLSRTYKYIVVTDLAGTSNMPIAAAVLDFTTGSYVIDGVSYTLGDLFETPSVDIGNTYTPGAVSASGWLCDGGNDNGPRAKGALATLLNSAHTAVLEWTDTSGNSDVNDVFVYSDKPAALRQQRGYTFSSGGDIQHRALTPANSYLGQATCSNTFRSSFDTDGRNRIAATIGSASSMVSLNGASPAGTIDHSAMLPNTFDDIQPLGSYMGSSGNTLEGYARRLEIYAVQTDAAVIVALSTL